MNLVICPTVSSHQCSPLELPALYRSWALNLLQPRKLPQPPRFPFPSITNNTQPEHISSPLYPMVFFPFRMRMEKRTSFPFARKVADRSDQCATDILQKQGTQ